MGMRTLLTIGLLAALLGTALAYPARTAPVHDTVDALSTGQVAGLTGELAEQAQSGLHGTILLLPAQPTWDLEGYARRTLAEWQATGAVPERAWLCLLVPSQNRGALVFAPELEARLDPWTVTALRERLALQAESGQLYLALQGVIHRLGTAPELQERSTVPAGRWTWLLAGMLILIATSIRGIRKHAAQRKP